MRKSKDLPMKTHSIEEVLEKGEGIPLSAILKLMSKLYVLCRVRCRDA